MLRSLCLLAALAAPAFAGFQNYREPDGLGGSTNRVVFEDREGALWFSGGPTRFDGVHWRVFRKPDGLPGDFCTALGEDTDGSVLAIMTDDSILQGTALCRFDGERWSKVVTSDDLGDAFSRMLVDHSGRLWLGGKTLHRRDPGGWTRVDLPVPGVVYALFEDRAGAIWAGGTLGLAKLDGDQWTRFPTIGDLPGSEVFALAQDDSGFVWAGTFRGLARVKDGTWETVLHEDFTVGTWVSALREDRDGRMWIGTGDGILRYDHGRIRKFRASDRFSTNTIDAITQDQSGNLWFGMEYDGVARFDGDAWVPFGPADGQNSYVIDALFAERSGAIWACGVGGAGRFDGGSWKLYLPPNGPPSPVHSMREDAAGKLWFSTDAGLTVFDGSTWTTDTGATSFGRVYASFAAQNGDVWALVADGVSRFDGATWTDYTWRDSLRSFYPSPLLVDGAGRVWAGGSRIARFEGGAWRFDVLPDSLRIDQCSAIFDGGEGRVWFVTDLGWLGYDGASWTRTPLPDSLGAWTGIAPGRNGTFWGWHGNRGISRFDGARWSEFLPFRQVPRTTVNSVLEDATGIVWVATEGSGVERFDGRLWIGDLGSGDAPECIDVGPLLEAPNGDVWLSTCAVTLHEPDRVAPQAVMSSRPAPVSSNARPAARVAAGYAESEGIQFRWALDGVPGEWTTNELWQGEGLVDGVHVLEAWARDFAGNVDPTPARAVFEVDATAPSPGLLAPLPGAALRDTIDVVGRTADARFAASRVEFRAVGAAAWSDLGDASVPVTGAVLARWDTRAVADGDYELRLAVTDTLGLVGSTVVTVQVDNAAPFADVTSPALVRGVPGGHVWSAHGEAEVYFPPAALSQDAVVRLAATTDAPDSLAGAGPRVGDAFDLDWGAAALRKPALLALRYDGPASPVVYASAGGADWSRLGGTVEGGILRVPVGGKGRLAVFTGRASPGIAALDVMAITPRVLTAAEAGVAIDLVLGRPSAVDVRVFNRAGRLVRVVADGRWLDAGDQVVRWDGRDDDGRAVPGGLYLVRAEGNGAAVTRNLYVRR